MGSAFLRADQIISSVNFCTFAPRKPEDEHCTLPIQNRGKE
jgi:hypothetical protein